MVSVSNRSNQYPLGLGKVFREIFLRRLYSTNLKTTRNIRNTFLAGRISLNDVIYSLLTFLKYSPDYVRIWCTFRFSFWVIYETFLLLSLRVFPLAHLATFLSGKFSPTLQILWFTSHLIESA